MTWWNSLVSRFKRPAQTTLSEGWFGQWLVETRFLHRFPHYAGLLCRIDPVATSSVDTMAIALRRWDEPHGRLQLLVNTAAFETRGRFRVGILLHELQHVVLGHLSNEQLHAIQRPLLMELAMEVSANEDIREPLPPSVQWNDFSRLGLAPRQSTLERYLLLCRAQDAGLLPDLALWTSRMLDVHRPQRAAASRAAGLGDLIDARSDGATTKNWSGGGLGLPTHPMQLEQMKTLLREHLGAVDGGAFDTVDLQRPRVGKELERLVQPSRNDGSLDWKRVLQQAFQRQRRARPDYLRPNRRYASRVGEVPGRTRRRPRANVLVAIDTSGSMGVTELERVAREVEQLGRVALVTVVECDAALHRFYPLRRPLGPFIGGGDTDFAPVLESPESTRFDGLVYFTDGRAPLPTNPRKVPTLWVVTHDQPQYLPFGQVIRLP